MTDYTRRNPMNTIRTIAIALPMTLLLACGGGGGGGGTAARTPTMTPPTNMPGMDDMMTPAPNPLANLANFESSTGHASIQTVSGIATTTNADLLTSNVAEVGNFGSEPDINCIPSASVCSVPILPNDDTGANLRFQIGTSLTAVVKDISLIPDTDTYFFDYTSMVTPSLIDNGVTLARGSLTGTRTRDVNSMRVAGHPIEVETFAGWLDGSIFGTTQLSLGTSSNEEYRFISYLAGVPATNNPSAAGGSATWEGAAVGSIKADRTFILGDASVTVNFTDTNVDLMFDNWRGLDNQAVSGMSAITYNDLTLANGSFEGSGNEQVQGRFYGTGHTEVGGFFNTETVTGAFGGTRQ